MTNLSDSNIIL